MGGPGSTRRISLRLFSGLGCLVVDWSVEILEFWVGLTNILAASEEAGRPHERL